MPKSPPSAPLSVFDAQLARVFEAAECRTQAELAALLGIRQSSISDAKRRKSIPAEWLVKLFTKKRINLDWILCGEGGKYVAFGDARYKRALVERVTEVRPPEACSAQDLFNELLRRALRGEGGAAAGLP